MSPRKLLARLLISPTNVRFGDFVRMLAAFGFRLLRIRGSHHIFGHPGIAEVVNIQDYGGQVKPYQIRQFLRLVERYNLELEDRA